MATTGTVYALAEPDTGNVRYCGKTVCRLNHRMNGHKRDAGRGCRRHLYNWLKAVYSAGREPAALVCETIKLAGLDRPEQLRRLNEAERRWISQLRALGFDLTNATNGGDGCHGRTVAAETRAMSSASNRGQKRSPDARQRMRQSALRRDPATRQYGENHHAFGKPTKIRDRAARIAKLRDWWDVPGRREAAGVCALKQIGVPKKLTKDLILAVHEESGSFVSIAKKYGVHRKTVAAIKRGSYAALLGFSGMGVP